MEKIFYRAEENESVISVAERLNVPAVKIIGDNNLSHDIGAGDMLYIEKAEGELYNVKPWDTFLTVAKFFGRDECELREKNGNVPYIFYGLKILI